MDRIRVCKQWGIVIWSVVKKDMYHKELEMYLLPIYVPRQNQVILLSHLNN